MARLLFQRLPFHFLTPQECATVLWECEYHIHLLTDQYQMLQLFFFIIIKKNPY